jgi:hypothetical protein
VDGKAEVVYLPYPKPQVQYIREMKLWLPGWMKNEDIHKAYSVLGDVTEQVKLFFDFAEGVTV